MAVQSVPVQSVPVKLMPVNFSNVNTIWASILVETLYRIGLTTAVVCPGSRSAPLAFAFAQHPAIDTIPVLDERSAAFFALGLAKQLGQPIALVCTSGTAGANFYPAIIEASTSAVPLLVLTADRPPELRDCNAGQTIDQQKLYGTYPNWYGELAVPSFDLSLLAYLRQTVIYAWERSIAPVAGVVHLNLPFREPLTPVSDREAETLAATFTTAAFFSCISTCIPKRFNLQMSGSVNAVEPLSELFHSISGRGIIIAGVAQPHAPQSYCEAIAHLSQSWGYPVLAEGLSPLRNYADLNPHLISTYDLMLRSDQLAEKLAPDLVIRIGEMPTSKTLRNWLTKIQPRQWVIDPGDRNLDPLHGNTTHLRISVEQFAAALSVPSPAPSHYLEFWKLTEARVRRSIDQTFAQIEHLFEGKVAWILSQFLPPHTSLLIANSMPVRDVECFWQPGNLQIQPYFNRGTNGIDGTLSTALGIAHRHQSSVLLTGDLALLHDTNGFLLRNHFVGHLTIVLINNNGGGIFEMLPIAQFDPPFEEFFATPQNINFAQLCLTYGVEHELIQSWQQLQQKLSSLPETGIRVLEVQTDRKLDAKWRQENLKNVASDSL
jgi:2-succinyl-5-enolpyruvyl-6-hydroxy-3-cyclohexene-1-carboxylate synthase